MNNIQPAWLSGLIGTVSPFIVNWIVKENFTRKQKSIIALVISAVIGFSSAYLSGNFHTEAILKSTAAAFTISQIVYDQLFKDIFNKKKIDKKEIPFA
jgi:MFS-type transporter involved in bile tolerance (Atg22 family)